VTSDVIVPHSHARCELPPPEGGKLAPVAIMRWVPATHPDIRQIDYLASSSSLEYQHAMRGLSKSGPMRWTMCICT
jgi:hypothetical protein